ncbi:GNAT family N-acetyltransferase [Dictyobacter aurantiacus]|uniref:N-acetyltransferase n=1 Tax=Dictyobacter aurantiacus TaxID=1936993 RepID=A0A401ZPJ2_9CHLR|nr:GNAT family N-acetyltransferase [Dictyobacter aurantiacus]GCE08730.1 N-acetyltransferase [Dictyobacter aurantiacus]
MNYKVSVTQGEQEQFASFIHEQIKEFNNQRSPHHKAARAKGAVKQINAIVTDEQGQWLGGLAAEQYWNWLEINDFWLPEELRNHGLGSSLLAQVEQLGRENGAQKVLLTTFEFQGRTFYERHGYKVVGIVEDYPPGSCYYTMVKNLS